MSLQPGRLTTENGRIEASIRLSDRYGPLLRPSLYQICETGSIDGKVSGSHSDTCARGTCRPFGSPVLHFRKELVLRHGDWRAAVARAPTPHYEGRVHVLHNLLGRTMTVLLGIFK